MKTHEKLPAITLENWEEWSEFYTNRVPTPAAARRVARVVGVLFKPQVHYRPGALESLANRDRTNTTHHIAPNHVSDADPTNMAAMLWRNRATRHLIDCAGVPSKLEVFNWHPFIHRRVNEVGTFPNVGERDLGENPTTERLGIYEDAKMAGKQLTKAKLHTVDALGSYLEGTRGREPRQVQPLKASIIRTIIDIGEARDIITYPVGTFYGEDVDPRKPSLAWRKPVMVVGQPISDYPTDLGEAVEMVHADMQSCLDEAVERSLTTNQASTNIT